MQRSSRLLSVLSLLGGIAALSFGRANAGASAPAPPAPTRALARDVLQHLIAINSTHAHGSSAAAQYVADQLRAAGFPDDERARIRRIALQHPQVRSVHDLRTRAAGPTAFIQIHLEMDGKLTLDEAHRISDAVEADLLAAFPQSEVMIHQDPEGVEEPRRSFPPPSASSRLAS